MPDTTQAAPQIAKEISRVFALQREHQWDVKASSAEQRKAKLARLKAAIEARADEIVAAVREDTRKPEGEIRVTEVLNVLGNIQLNIDNLDQVIEYIEDRDKPLALYVYSDNPDNVQKVLDRTSSGGVTVNGVFSHYLENRLPFGGVNGSGMGSYHGHFGFKAFSHERAVYVHREPA